MPTPHHRPHLRLMPFAPASPVPSPSMTTPATEPITFLLSTSPAVPSIIITPPAATFSTALGGSAPEDLISQARRRRARRTPPPSPHLLCVGWRRRADSFADPYGLVSDRSRSRKTDPDFSYPSPSALISSALLSLAQVIVEADVAGYVSNTIAAVLPSASSSSASSSVDDKDKTLPLYAASRRRRRQRSPATARPLAIFAFLFAIALALSLAINGSIMSLSSPLAANSNTNAGAYGRHAYAHSQYGRYYDIRLAARRASEKRAPAAFPYHHGTPRSADATYGGTGKVGIRLPRRGQPQAAQQQTQRAEVRSLADALASGGFLNPWDFH